MIEGIGCHVPMHHSKKSAEELGADVVQIHLGSPQKWGMTALPKGEIAEHLYVHSPYLINLSSHDERVLGLARETLMAQSQMCAEIGAKGLVVHGGSWKKLKDREKALSQWEETLAVEHPCPILIENSANGEHSLTRRLADVEELWARVSHPWVGFCLDTAHLWANVAHENHAAHFTLELRHIVGHIQLVHANGSGVESNSGVDKHSPLASSIPKPEWVGWCCSMAQPDDVIAESTDPAPDVLWLKEFLAGH